ncbi:phage tail spike protein [Alkalihalobacillus sp. NPDC078783]
MAEIYIFNPSDELLTTISPETGLISAPFREEKNRLPEEPFTFTVDASFEETVHIKEENQVVFKDKEGDLRLYVIKELDDSDGVKGPETTAVCEPAFMELKERIVIDRRFTNQEAQVALNAALQGTGWKGTVEVELGTGSTNFYYENAIDCIWKIIDVWGGEFKDVVTFDKSSITLREIKILNRRGYDRGKRFEIDHNMEGIRRTVLSYPITAIYGRGASLEITDEEGNATGGNTRFIDFADVEWKKSNGDPVDKPKGQRWVGDPDALKKYGRLRNGTILHREAEWQNGDYEDPKELLQATWDQLQLVKAPEVNYQLDAYLFESIAGYEHEHVALGDTARAIDRNFSKPIEIQSRVIAISYDLVDIEGTAEIEMGQFLSVHEYDDRLDKVTQKVGNNSGAWDQAARPIDGSRYPDTIPPVPPNVKATGLFAMALVEWDFDYVRTFIQGYEVFASEVKGFLPSPETMVYRGSANSYSYEGETNKQYYFRVRAFNYHQRYSLYSEEVSATTAKIISDDIFFGPELAAELRELSKQAQIIADNTLSGKALVDGTIIDSKIAQGAIDMQHLKPGIVDLDKMSEDAIRQIRENAKGYTDEEIAKMIEQLQLEINEAIKDIDFDEASKELRAEIAKKAGLEYVDGKFRFNDLKLQELDEIAQRLRNEMTDIDGKVNSIEVTVDDVEGKLDIQAKQLEQTADTLTAHSASIKANATDIGLRVTKDQLDKVSGDLTTSIGNVKLTVDGFSSEFTRVNRRMDGIDTKQSEFATTIDGLSNTVKTIETRTGDNAGEITSVKTRTSTLEQKSDRFALTLQTLESEVGKTETYRAISVRYNNNTLEYYPIRSGLYDSDGNRISKAGNDRSYLLGVYDKKTRQWQSQEIYDVYGNVGEALRLAEDLNALDKDKIVVLIGTHAPGQNRLNHDLPKAIYRCGGSKTVFELADGWGTSHPAYILIGVPGMGEGQGKEHFSPGPHGWLDVSFNITNGNLDLDSSGGAMENRVSKTETSITAVEGSISLLATKEEIKSKVDTDIYNRRQTELNTSLEGIRGSVTDVKRIADKATGDVSSLTTRTNKLELDGNGFRTSISTLETGLRGKMNEYLIDFKGMSSSTDYVILLTRITANGTTNYVNGTIHGRRVSGHVATGKVEILFNNNSSGTLPVGYMEATTIQGGDTFSLVSVIYENTRYLALRHRPTDQFRLWNTDSVFIGQIGSTGEMLLAVQTSEVTSLQNFVSELPTISPVTKFETAIEQTDRQVALRAQEITALGTRVSKAESDLTVQSNQINARVTKDGLVTELNLRPESLKIKSGLIHLAGNSRIDNAVIQDAHINNLSGDKILANTIGAKQLLISDFTNLIVNGDFEDDPVREVPNGWFAATNNAPGNGYVSDMSAWSGGNGSVKCFTLNGSPNGNVEYHWDKLIPVTPGEELFYSFRKRHNSSTAGTNTCGLSVRRYDQARNHHSYGGFHINSDKHTGWREYSGTWVVPAGVYYIQPRAYVQTEAGTTSNMMHIDDIVIKKKATGELIVDGSIEARHIKADTITANSGIIATAAIGTAAIANGAITRAKLENAIIGTAQIENGAISNAKIGNAAIDNAKIANTTITSAKVASIDAAKINAGTVTGIRLRSVDTSSWFEVQGGRIRMEMTNGRHMTIDNTGIYYLERNGNILFQSSQKLTTSDIFGTAEYNVYLAAFNESRSVTYSTALTGSGNVADYVYVPHRAQGFYGNYLNVNPYGSAVNIYLRPLSGGEVRVTRNETDDDYQSLRAGTTLVHRLQLNPWNTNTRHLHLGAEDEVRIASSPSANDGLGVVRAATVYASSITMNATGNASHLNLFVVGAGEVRVRHGNDGGYANARALNFYENSTVQSKTDIKPFTGDALNEIDRIEVMEYLLKDNISRGIHEVQLGFIAEQSPFVASYDGEAVILYKALSLNTKGIQELSKYRKKDKQEVEALKLEVASLKREIEQLKSA